MWEPEFGLWVHVTRSSETNEIRVRHPIYIYSTILQGRLGKEWKVSSLQHLGIYTQATKFN